MILITNHLQLIMDQFQVVPLNLLDKHKHLLYQMESMNSELKSGVLVVQEELDLMTTTLEDLVDSPKLLLLLTQENNTLL